VGFVKRYRYLIVGAMVVLLLVMLAGATVVFRERISAVEQRLLAALAPLQRAATSAGQSVREFWVSLAELRDLREENARLRAEVERLRSIEPILEETRQESERLAALLGFAPPEPYQGLAARLVGRTLSNWFSTIEISRGARDGVRAGDPVVTQYGLVGKVVRATETTATVLLLVDPQSGVGAQIVRSREPGALVGSVSFKGTCTMRLFSREADVVPGDHVLTSGLGDVYPPDLHVGIVAEVRREEEGLVIVAEITPAVDFGRLDEVFVLVAR
jgi:rod shape-determining protein MreC